MTGQNSTEIWYEQKKLKIYFHSDKKHGITENVAEEIYRFFHEDTSKKNGDVV